MKRPNQSSNHSYNKTIIWVILNGNLAQIGQKILKNSVVPIELKYMEILHKKLGILDFEKPWKNLCQSNNQK